MQINTGETAVPMRTSPPGDEAPEAKGESYGAHAAFLDTMEIEALALTLEASLDVQTQYQLFSWTQGLLQNLIQHELLICALRKGEAVPFHVDTISSATNDPALVSTLFGEDTSLVPHLIKLWEDNHFRPVTCEVGKYAETAGRSLARELKRVGAEELMAHGTYDALGHTMSFFVFGCRPGSVELKRAHFLELIVPSLHAAWMRTQVTRPVSLESTRANSGRRSVLTVREQEILEWIYRGKGNIEIGMILGISPLTVKNHVQKILRRLSVRNRAQAVGKALALRMIDG
jgi:transcriptional regulator EpsA